jgi:hypothetical protein
MRAASMLLLAAGAGCGDGQRRSPSEPVAREAPAANVAANPRAVQPTGGEGCEPVAPAADRLALPRSAIIRLRTRVLPIGAVQPEDEAAVRSAFAESVADRLRREGRDPAIFETGAAAETVAPGDVVLTICVSRGAAAGSYRLQVMAVQNGRRWSETVERPEGKRPDYRGIADEDGRPRGNPMLESLVTDLRMIGAQFGRALDL